MIVFFTKEAWRKQCALIHNFDTEIAWHGLVRQAGNGYCVYDIVVYPQEVTGGTVNTDQVAYQDWLMSQSDEVFNHIRYQGHSHVNMQPYPSSVDLDNQNRMQVPDDDFYLFAIWNKHGFYTMTLYDHGRVYDHTNIDLRVEDEYAEFVQQARSMLTTKSYVKEAVQSESEQKS